MDKLHEKKIIQDVLSGDKNAFALLIEENQKNVYNLALKLTKNHDDALDISQEVFVKAYTSLGDFRGDCRFSVWLYRLTYNMCIDLTRKKSAEIIHITQTDDDGDITDLQLPDNAPLPEEALEKKELRKEVAKVVAGLPEKYRRILILREYNELSYDEIAAELGISVGTVKSRLARARYAAASILLKSGTFTSEKRHNIRKEDL